ncbi:MAG: phenylacetate-CoA oxygenase subunit PaaI [Chitinophagia bacterium]|nr:phenylacetate-CoA oxygenase subunit PaaI [Chitinophagia bacterium]
MTNPSLVDLTLYLADSTLVLGQRNGDWCGHGPVLEQDIAITNITLDLIGQARSFYQYAAQLIGNGCTEDQLAYWRNEREFKNCLLCERPNGDWAQTILRQTFFSFYQRELFTQLLNGTDSTLSAIAEKSLKEISYHCRWSGEWVCRLGDGTEESHHRLAAAVENLWPYVGELFIAAPYEIDMQIDTTAIKSGWSDAINTLFAEATLSPVSLSTTFMHTGGKTGQHTEALGYLLAEMQYVQRSFPGCEW